jgi:hypothetical protein
MSEEVKLGAEALAALQGLGDSDTSQEFRDLSNKGQGIAEPTPEVTNTNEAQGSENLVENPPAENVEETSSNAEVANEVSTETQTPENEVEKVTNPMFGDKDLSFKPEEPKTEDEGSAEVNSFEDMDKYLNENFGVANADELKSKLDSIGEYEKQVGELSSYRENVEGNLNSLPIALNDAIAAALNGEDWRSKIENSLSVDLNKSADDFSAKELIDAFFPNEFSDEDWDEYNDEDGNIGIKKAIKMAENTAKTRFNDAKEAKKKEYDDRANSNKVKSKQYSESIDLAAKSAIENIAGIDEGYVSNLVSEVKSKGIIGFFMNSDGTLKEDAIVRLIKSTSDYDNYRSIQTNNAIKEALNKERQEMLSRGNSTPSLRTGSSASQEDLRPEVKKRLEEIVALKEKQGF